MKHYLYIFLIPIALNCYAQKKSIVLVDNATNKPVQNAHVVSSNHQVVSDKGGRVFLLINSNIKIRISHVSYRDTSLSLDFNSPPDTLRLQKATKTLNEVKVSAKPQIVFKPEERHVFDYEFFGDKLIILTYEREKMFRRADEQSTSLYLGCDLLLISPNGKIEFERKLTDEIRGIHRDPLGKLYLLTAKNIFLLRADSGLELIPIDMEDFHDHIKPLKAAAGETFVLDNYRWHYPEFSYFKYYKKNDSLIHLRTIRDDFTMELLRSEYKYQNNRDKLWAYRKELETGIDKEVISAYKAGFQSSLYYQSLYAPVFDTDTCLVVFDHHAKFIFTHSLTSVCRDSVRICYLDQNKSKFNDLVLKDRKENFFYAIFKKGGVKYMGRINIFTGRVNKIKKLYYPFPENIKMRDGKAYYLFRKAESENYTYLYSEYLN